MKKDIWKFGPEQRKMPSYSKESIRHPAKMSLYLCREIIKRYSKVGDLILDPMAGIGTTVIEGMLMGRDVIGVEYEQKFCDIAQDNVERVEICCGYFGNLGRGKMICGDSRFLSKILAENSPDIIVSSPPYGGVNVEQTHMTSKNRGDPSDPNYRPSWKKKLAEGYAESKRPYGEKADSVIFSPPYSNAIVGKEVDIDKKVEKYREMEERAIAKGNKFGRTSEEKLKNNIESLEDGYSMDKSNVGNLRHGDVDIIITSPPYGHESTTSRTSKKKNPGDIHQFIIGDREDNYSDDPENAGNLSGQTYLEAMLAIYKECYKVLKDSGVMVLVTKNFVRSGKQVRLDLDTIKLCESAGFKLFKRHYRKINNPSFWITIAIQKWEKKHPGVPHPYALEEDVLVFKKG